MSTGMRKTKILIYLITAATLLSAAGHAAAGPVSPVKAENGEHKVVSKDTKVVVITQNRNVYAVHATGKGSFIRVESGSTAEGSREKTSSFGVCAEEGAGIDMVENHVDTHTQRSYGVYAHGSGSVIRSVGTKITTKGNYANGIYSHSGALARISGAEINTSGDQAYALHANIMDSQIEVTDSLRIAASGKEAHGVFALNGGQIEIKNIKDSVITVYRPDAAAIAVETTDERDSYVTCSGVVAISGDVRAIAAKGSSRIGLRLEDGSSISGAMMMQTSQTGTAKLELSLTGKTSVWNMTGDSHISRLELRDSVVDLSGASETTLTIQELGDGNGKFIMKVNAETGVCDQIDITGEARGDYEIEVVNSGAVAPDVAQKMTLVKAESGTANFSLVRPVEMGAWQYTLDAYSGEWGLAQTANASNAASGAVNTFSGAYLMSRAETHTLHQRLGDLRETPGRNGAWFRAHGGKFESGAKNFAKGFDMKYGGVQIGYDRKASVQNSDIRLGVMFGYGKGDLKYLNSGKGEVDSKTVGVYATYGCSGTAYADLTLKYQWMDNRFDVLDSAGGRVTGGGVRTGGLGASLEIGKRFNLENRKKTGWYIEPQAQLSYSRQSGGAFRAANGLNIAVNGFTSLIGRAGISIGYDNGSTNFFVKAAMEKEFDGSADIIANGELIPEDFGGSCRVVGIGFTSQLDGRNSLYFSLGHTKGDSFSRPWAVNAGWRIAF